MAKLYPAISDDHRAFIEQQPLFFVASAPMTPAGHVNVSPKGLDAFRVIDESTIAYLDLTGSGNETAAHVTENGRLTIMFCAFQGKPKILRLYCRGRVVTRESNEWPTHAARFAPQPGMRQIVVGNVESVLTSCGFGVPLMTFAGQRDQLPRWAASKGEDGLVEYRRAKNAISLDGLLSPVMD